MDPLHPATAPRRTLDPRWSAPLVFLILGLLFLLPALLKAIKEPSGLNNKDYTLWYEIGAGVRAGEPLYAQMLYGEVKYMYPSPLAVLLFAPASAGPPWVLVSLMGIATALAWAGCVRAAMVLTTGGWRGRPRWLYVLPGIAVGAYVWDLQGLGQVNLVLLFCTLAAFVAIRRGRPILGGSLFGIAVAVKVFPLPAIVYLAARRQWRAVASSLLMCGLLWVVVPGSLRGFDRTFQELGEWSRLMVADQSGDTMGGRSSIGFTRRNQSLISLAHRLLRPVDAGDDVPLKVNLASVSPKEAQLVGYAACFALGLVLLWATRMQFAPTVEAEGLEIGMVCTLVVLCSPLSWTYFFCWLLPAWTAVSAAWMLPGQRNRRIAIAGSIVAGLLLLSAVSEQYDARLQACGVTAWGAVVLFLTLALLRQLASPLRQRGESLDTSKSDSHG